MEKTQVYLRKTAARSGRSVAELVRDAIRKVVLKPQADDAAAVRDVATLDRLHSLTFCN